MWNLFSVVRGLGDYRLWIGTSLFSAIAAGQDVASLADFERHAADHPGDARRGRELFSAPSSLCSTCHSIDGSASKLGPDLGAIGDKFNRRDLIRSVLEPSSAVAVGFGTTTIETNDGESHTGIVKSATPEVVELMGADGKLVKIPMAGIKSQQTAEVSLMPAGLNAVLGMDGFSDVIAYLETLHAQAVKQDGSGTLDSIPLCSRQAELEPLFAMSFDHPTWFGWVPGCGTEEGVVLEHAGKLWAVDLGGGKEERRLLLDLTDIVRRGGATGLLGMDFHPGFEKNRRYFLKYQVVENGVISTVIDERTMKPDRLDDAGAAPRQIIKIRSVTQDHNGGSIGFGPDGFLYFGMGDTGPQRDPQGHGQDTSMLLGKLMRIDVDHPGEGLPYAIPADNPFRDVEGVRPEIWASGFREPYRLTWDTKTGDLWVGDVGQDRIEEVSIVRRGENLGWNVYEGHQPFSERYRRPGENYVPPVMSYSHRIGVSVTGGQVYRGTQAPQMEGWYVLADHESRRIWALTQQDRKLQKVVEIARSPSRVTAISKDPAGELYVVGFDNGRIYRLKLDKVDPRPLETRVVAATSEGSGLPWHFTRERPATGWQGEGFDASAWAEGPAGFGSAGTPGGNIRTEWRGADLWMRRDFEVSPELAALPGDLIVRMHHDEDVEVFLNGTEILQRPGFTREYGEEKADAAGVLKPGRNVLAVHCHQNGGGQFIDVGLLKSLTPGP